MVSNSTTVLSQRCRFGNPNFEKYARKSKIEKKLEELLVLDIRTGEIAECYFDCNVDVSLTEPKLCVNCFET